jgi:tRNA U55 pseudouridine synthase TruB
LDSIIFQEDKETLLPLPTFSAKKQNWRRLYKDARKWKAEIQEKQMKIYKYEILSYSFPYLKIRFSVGSWTYIRSIGYWLGKELGLWWALIQLERTSIWKFNLSEIGTEDLAKGNIKWEERYIYYKEVDLELIKNPD